MRAVPIEGALLLKGMVVFRRSPCSPWALTPEKRGAFPFQVSKS